MAPNSLVWPAVILGVTVGLGLLLYAEAAGAGDVYLLAGGVLVIAAMALLTYVLSAMEGGEPADH